MLGRPPAPAPAGDRPREVTRGTAATVNTASPATPQATRPTRPARHIRRPYQTATAAPNNHGSTLKSNPVNHPRNGSGGNSSKR